MSGCPVCGGEGRVYRMTTAYETMATQAAGSSFGWTGQTHEWRTCHACGGSGLLPAVLLRDTPEDRERLAAVIHKRWHRFPDEAGRLADAILAELRGER